MKRKEPEYCFYCDAALARGRSELDHYPVPRCKGGKETVKVCIVCHDQKDRFALRSWGMDAVSDAISGSLSGEPNRWSKILLAKAKVIDSGLAEKLSTLRRAED